MVQSLESMENRELQHLTSEIMARDGYSVKLDPNFYPEIDLIATSAYKNKNRKNYIIIAGRTTSEYLTKTDMRNCLPDPMELSSVSQLLLVTNCRSSSRKARKIAHNDPTRKSAWYLSNLLSKIRDLESEYLIELYDKNSYDYTEKETLQERLHEQEIELSQNCIDYIVEDTYHPRKIIAYIEFSSRGIKTDLHDLPAIKRFRSKFNYSY